MVEVILIGAGDRGKDRYGKYIETSQDIRIVAVAEPDPIKRAYVVEKHGIDETMAFESWEPLIGREKFCDGVIIATSDDDHYEPAIAALKRHYHVLLEKPMSNKLEEILAIAEAEQNSQGQVLVCHVLRYTPLYKTLKELLEEGRIGRLLTIQHNENIGYYHFAHSFVRGNWRNTLESSPLILAKSCHDMDILYWLVNAACQSVASYGTLSYFRSEHSRGYERCLQCQVHETCPFAVQKIYHTLNQWPTSTITPVQTWEGVQKALSDGPYGRCVYHCDNNVVDHQVSIFNFDNGVTATFNLSAFTNDISRTMKLMGTEGTIKVKDAKNEIIVQRFGQAPEIIIPQVVAGGHGGGDTGIMDDFVALLKGQPHNGTTNAQTSVMSHIMAFAAERARIEGRNIAIKDMKKTRRSY